MGNPSTGIFVEEVDNVASRQIQGLPTNTSGMVVRALRGWVNKKVKVNNIGRYRRIFGGPDPNSYSYESVAGLFDAAGRSDGGNSATGVDLWVNRVVGTGSGSNVAAELDLDTPIGTSAGSITGTGFPVIMDDGTTFIGAVDQDGTPPTVTINAKQATYTGSGATYAAPVNGHFLDVNVAGTIRRAVFASTDNTQAEYLIVLNAVPGLSAKDVGGEVRLTIDQKGSGSTGQIMNTSSSDVLASLGFTGGAAFTNAGPNNVVNANMPGFGVTSAELAALFNANFTGSTTTYTASTLTWTSDNDGPAPNGVQFTGGTGVALVTGFDNVEHNGVTATAPVACMTFTAVGPGAEDNYCYVIVTSNDTNIGGIAEDVAAGSTTQIKLTPAAAGRVKVGDTLYFADSSTSRSARGYVARIDNQYVTFETAYTIGSGGLTAANTVVKLETFTFAFYYRGDRLRYEAGLRMSPLSVQNYFVTRINNGDDEQQVTVTDHSPAVGADNRPVNVISTGDYLSGGSEANVFVDADWIGSSSTPKTGLYVFDSVPEVRRIAIPGVIGTNNAVVLAGQDYCEDRKDCRYVFSTGPGVGLSAALTFFTAIPGSSYVSSYYPWVQVLNAETNQPEYFPPEGWVLGMNARCNAGRGIAKAPAGTIDGRLPVLGVELDLDTDGIRSLNTINVNSIIKRPAKGTYVNLARTTQAAGNTQQIHARDTLIFLETSIREGLEDLYLEPNTDNTRSLAKSRVESFLETQWRAGTLDGNTAGEAFAVICDRTNNPPELIAAQELIVEVEVNIPGTIERAFLKISPNKTNEGA